MFLRIFLLSLASISVCAGTANSADVPSLPKGSTVVESGAILIAMPPSNKTAYGFSAATGKVDAISLGTPTDAVVPTVSRHVACLMQGKEAYAFGLYGGKWSKVTLNERADPVVGYGIVCITAGTKAYAFGSHSTKWAMIEVGMKSTPAVSYFEETGGVAKVESDSCIYLFSNASKEWQIIDLSDGQ